MATLIELNSAGSLSKLDPALEAHRQEERSIYVLPRLQNWFIRDLPNLGSTWNIEQSPAEQLDALFATFCSGDVLTFNRHFKPLNHLRNGIWELKTADLRVFGWFPMKDCFIGSAANLADQIKRSRMYRPYCDQAVRDRDSLDLNHPKFIAGDKPDGVVSAYSFA